MQNVEATSLRSLRPADVKTEPNYFAVRQFRRETPDKFLGYPLIVDRDRHICDKVSPNATRVLEIGAGDRSCLALLRGRGFAGTFKTMDIDRTRRFDYYAIEEIEGQFDAVIMREVIEHLPRSLFYSYLEKIYRLLEPGGVLVLTTPNPWAPGWVYADYTHTSFWPPADLYAILRWYHFRPVEIYRVVWPSKWMWLKRAYWAMHSRFYDIDFAGSCLACATKPISSQSAKQDCSGVP